MGKEIITQTISNDSQVRRSMILFNDSITLRTLQMIYGEKGVKL